MSWLSDEKFIQYIEVGPKERKRYTRTLKHISRYWVKCYSLRPSGRAATKQRRGKS